MMNEEERLNDIIGRLTTSLDDVQIGDKDVTIHKRLANRIVIVLREVLATHLADIYPFGMELPRPALIELHTEAIDLWGEDLQIGMLYEEMGELMQAVNKLRRIGGDGLGSAGRRGDVYEEIADVRIMCEEIATLVGGLHGHRIVKAHYDAKLKRLRDMIAEETAGPDDHVESSSYHVNALSARWAITGGNDDE